MSLKFVFFALVALFLLGFYGVHKAYIVDILSDSFLVSLFHLIKDESKTIWIESTKFDTFI